ncbi:unnamed protein product [Caenorhabditis nigoni]
MFPALGVCRQLKPPYPFGSAFIHFIESWHGGTFLIDYQLGIYTSFLRPYGNDLETCVMPWVFYLTHPAFRIKPGSNPSSSTQRFNLT